MLYEYKCGVCSHITTDLREIKDRNKIAICEKCGCVARKILSHFTAITDTNFFCTGEYDRRLGGPKIEGRKDWERRVEEKGFRPMEPGERGYASPTTVEERIEKAGLQVM